MLDFRLMKSLTLHDEFLSRPFDETIVRDVLGEPEAWANCISDEASGVPDMRSAVILDVFVKQQHIFLYIQGQDGGETLAIFFIEDQDLREKIAEALRTAVEVLEALQTSL